MTQNAILALAFIVLLAVVLASVVLTRMRRKSEASPTALPTVPLTTLGPYEAEAWVRSHIKEIAETQFPDNPGLEWRIHAMQHRERLLFAEVEPLPSEVGYDRFQFAFSYADTPTIQHVATYCLDGGQYKLLSTSRNAPKMPRLL